VAVARPSVARERAEPEPGDRSYAGHAAPGGPRGHPDEDRLPVIRRYVNSGPALYQEDHIP